MVYTSDHSQKGSNKLLLNIKIKCPRLKIRRYNYKAATTQTEPMSYDFASFFILFIVFDIISARDKLQKGR